MTRRTSRAAMPLTLAALASFNVAALVWAWATFRHSPELLGMALLAWTLGLRHAVDADHIAAIDNVVRKLTQTGRRAWDCGFFFAIGHSTVVVGMCLAIVALPSTASIDAAREALGLWGTVVSAGFLAVIALTNLRTLRRLIRARAEPDGALSLADTPLAGGVMNRVLRPVRRLAERSWHMLPVGFLFGLGFDTASEIALLALTSQQTVVGVPPGAIMLFPVLFAAGMALIDTADSAVMTGAYGWALRDPGRKLAYNIAVTGLSVFVAFAIGGLELISLFHEPEDHATALWKPIDLALNILPYAGFAIVVALVSVWGVASLVSRSRARLEV